MERGRGREWGREKRKETMIGKERDGGRKGGKGSK